MSKKFQTLDIGSSKLTLAEFELGANGVTLRAYGIAPLDAPLDALSAPTILPALLGQLCHEHGIRPGRLAMSVSGQLVFPRCAPIMAVGNSERFEEAIRMEIEQNIPFPADELVCAHQLLGENESGEQNVFIVASKTDQVEAFAAGVAAAGFTLELLTASSVATINVLKALGTVEPSIVLDFGARTTSLAIVAPGRIYNRLIPAAGNLLTKEIGQALACTVSEAETFKYNNAYVSLGGVVEDEDPERDRVAKTCRALMTRIDAEISRSINFFQSQQNGAAPVKMLVTGGGSMLPQLVEFFAATRGIEVEYLNPLAAVGVAATVDSAALEGDLAVLSPCVGLALQMAGAAEVRVNLLPPTVVQMRLEARKIPVVAVAAVLIVLAGVFAYLYASGNRERLEAKALTLEEEVSRLRSYSSKINAVSAELKLKEESVGKLSALIASRSMVAQRLETLRRAMGENLWIDEWDADGRVTIRGWSDLIKASQSVEGSDPRPVSEQVVERLKALPTVVPESVRVVDMKQLGNESEVEQFTLQMEFK